MKIVLVSKWDLFRKTAKKLSIILKIFKTCIHIFDIKGSSRLRGLRLRWSGSGHPTSPS
jgi:hypothetical protein